MTDAVYHVVAYTMLYAGVVMVVTGICRLIFDKTDGE